MASRLLAIFGHLTKIISTVVDSLDRDQIERVLTTKWLGRSFQVHESVTSTNELLRHLANGETPTGFMIISEYQSKGRGRLDRSWEAPPGTSILCSLLFRPQWPAYRANWLNMIGGIAAVEAIQDTCDLSTRLKWPNDIICRSREGWFKVGGLLLDSIVTGGLLSRAIIGIGINVNIPADEIPATSTPASSLSILWGQPIPRVPLLGRYLAHLENLYAKADSNLSPVDKWREILLTLGRQVRVTGSGDRDAVEGVAEDVDEYGNLLVRDNEGISHTISAGDVTLRV